MSTSLTTRGRIARTNKGAILAVAGRLYPLGLILVVPEISLTSIVIDPKFDSEVVLDGPIDSSVEVI